VRFQECLGTKPFKTLKYQPKIKEPTEKLEKPVAVPFLFLTYPMQAKKDNPQNVARQSL